MTKTFWYDSIILMLYHKERAALNLRKNNESLRMPDTARHIEYYIVYTAPPIKGMSSNKALSAVCSTCLLSHSYVW